MAKNLIPANNAIRVEEDGTIVISMNRIVIDGYDITFPSTGIVAILNNANVFTAVQEINYSSASGVQLKIENPATTENAVAGIELALADSGSAYIRVHDPEYAQALMAGTLSIIGTSVYGIALIADPGVGSGSAIKFMQSVDSENARIEEGGNFGLGASDPISLMEIRGGLTTGGAILTLGTKEPSVVAGDILGRIDFYAPLDTGTDSDETGASIVAIAEDTFSDTVNATSIHLRTSASGGSTVTAMAITSELKVGIGDTDPATLLVLSANNNLQTENNTLRFADTDLAAGSPQQIGKIEFYSNDSSPDGAGITSYIQGLHVTSGEGALIFATGTIASLAEHMRIDHEGLTTITGSVKTTVPLGYAEMYMYDNVTECVIDTANIYHAIYNTFGNNDGTLAPLIDTTHFTYKAGVGEIVASIVTYDAGNKIQCTVTAGHSFLAGEPVTLSGFATGAGTYNGVYLIEAAGLTATEFVVAVAYTGDEAGSVRKPATMECLVAGNYNAGFNFSGTAGNPNDNIKIELNRDLTPLDNIVARGIWSSSSKYESLSARGLVALTVGQYVWASVKNYSGSGNFTFYSGNVNLCRLI